MQVKKSKEFPILQKPEILLLLILNGFLDSKLSAFQSFPLWGKKEDGLRCNEGMKTWGKTLLAYKQKSVGALLFHFGLNFLYLRENSELVFIPPIYVPIQSFHQLFHDIENPILSVQITKKSQV